VLINQYESIRENVNSTSVQVILFGYKRLDLLEKRLSELRSIAPSNLLVSIDFFSQSMTMDMTELLEKHSKNWPETSIIRYRILKKNLGLARHITETITSSLTEFQGIVVIEDDIEVSGSFMNLAAKVIQDSEFSKEYSSFCGFSGISLPAIFHVLNFLRQSPYFYCWGWATNRESWRGFTLNLDSTKFEKDLEDSRTWNSLTSEQKTVWLERFRKIAISPDRTWDTQFQYHSFKADKVHLIPLSRITENEGFGDLRGTNTFNPRPKWMLRAVVKDSKVQNRFIPKFAQLPITFWESIVLAGDQKKILRVARILSRIFLANRNPLRIMSRVFPRRNH
jgi:hypothetical protein